MVGYARLVTTRVNLFCAVLPGGKAVTAAPPGSPFGPGIVTLEAMRVTELLVADPLTRGRAVARQLLTKE